jgi:hypothetical protein
MLFEVSTKSGELQLRQGEASDAGRITPLDNVFRELIIEKLHGIIYKGVLFNEKNS